MIVSNSPENTLYDPGDVVESSYLFSLSEISSTLTFLTVNREALSFAKASAGKPAYAKASSRQASR